MSRAEDIKLALEPPQPSSAAAAGRGKGKGKGRTALSRPAPSASDVRGNLRVREVVGRGGVPCRALHCLVFASTLMEQQCSGK